MELEFITAAEIDPGALHKQLSEALGETFLGVKTYGTQVWIILDEKAQAESVELVKKALETPPLASDIPVEDRPLTLDQRLIKMEADIQLIKDKIGL